MAYRNVTLCQFLLQNDIMEVPIFTMREVKRIKVLQQLIAKQITNQQAADSLELTIRQVQRLKKAYLDQGDIVVIHKLRDKPSGRAYNQELRDYIIELYANECPGWNFSHFNDCLEDDYDITVSDRYVYNLLTAAGYKSPRKKKRKKKAHPPRDRKENAGELLQTDASIHPWIVLEDAKGGIRKYALHGIIDDATNIVTAVELFDEETNIGYQSILAETIRNYGIPECLYTDFRTVFQSPKKLTEEEKIEAELTGKELGATRFANMCKRIGIGIISTREPQAKGRIERLWESFQDRLTKELLRKGITTKEEANRYIRETFLPRYNKRFASQIDYNKNLFVPVGKDFNYNEELALSVKRKALKGCYISLDGQYYILQTEDGKTVNLPVNTTLEVFTCLDGTVFANSKTNRYNLKPIKKLATKPKPQRMSMEELAKKRSEYAKTNLNSPWRKYHAHV